MTYGYRVNLRHLECIIFPDQSPNQILNGYAKGSMPDEYTGGVGKEGVENLKKFVEAGGTLVFLNRSTEFAIEQFNLPIRNAVKGLNRKGVLHSGLDPPHRTRYRPPDRQRYAAAIDRVVRELARLRHTPRLDNLRRRAGNRLAEPSNAATFATIAIAYPTDPKQILLSGWALGADKIAGKAALVEVKIGKGKIILFGFRPQYRGQSLATFPLLFNAISQ